MVLEFRYVPALLTVDQVAQQLSLHPKTVLRHIRSGQLRATRIGKSYRITAEDLDEFTGTVREPSAARPQLTTVVDIPGCGAARAADLVRALHARVTGREPTMSRCAWRRSIRLSTMCSS